MILLNDEELAEGVSPRSTFVRCIHAGTGRKLKGTHDWILFRYGNAGNCARRISFQRRDVCG